MTFDSIILAAVSAELNRELAGGRVDKVHQPSPLDVVLTIRSGGANHSLLASAEAGSPRVHLTSTKRPNPQTPPNFCMLLRKYLEGARLAEVTQVDFDRVLHLVFSAYDGERLTLIVEIMGKHSNIILVNGTERILGAVKPIGRQKNRYREILPGRQYVPPPAQNKLDPLTVSREEFARLPVPDGDSAKWLTATFAGMSPFAARELVSRSGGERQKLAEEFFHLMDSVRGCNWSPVIINDVTGRTVGFYPFPSAQFPPSDQHARSSINSVADMYYTSALPRQAFEHAKEDFLGRLRRERESLQNALDAIEEGLSECEGAERFKQIGELILAQPGAVTAGAKSAELADYYDPDGGSVTVELDPQLSAPENAEAYFRRYRKAVSGLDTLRERRSETQGHMKVIRRILDTPDRITSVEQAKELQSVLESHGIRIRRQEERAATKRKPEFEGYRITRVESNGWEILVGQNSESNDYLLTRVAKPNDMWVHVKASPSAHVVIRTNGKPDAVPRGVLMAAAELAVKNSDQKHSSLVPVDYTLRKHVRKPKGAPAGKALYVNEKTLFITT